MKHLYSRVIPHFSFPAGTKLLQLPFRFFRTLLCSLSFVLVLLLLSGALKAAPVPGNPTKAGYASMTRAADSLEMARHQLRTRYLLRMQQQQNNKNDKQSREKEREEYKRRYRQYNRAMDSVYHKIEQRKQQEKLKQSLPVKSSALPRTGSMATANLDFINHKKAYPARVLLAPQPFIPDGAGPKSTSRWGSHLYRL